MAISSLVSPHQPLSGGEASAAEARQRASPTKRHNTTSISWMSQQLDYILPTPKIAQCTVTAG